MNQIDKKKLRQFAAALAFLCILLGILRIRRGSEALHIVFFGIACYSIISAIFYSAAIKPIYIVFGKIGRSIGWINTRIFLAAIFYLILTPTGILLRMIGKDTLNLRKKRSKKRGEETYWVGREKKSPDPKSYENQF